uniref:Macrophage-expressed gene 1 protein n=1 Tax=Panagrolaimus superbus TaxID=310955 RepID=A0A914YTA0_9BILA
MVLFILPLFFTTLPLLTAANPAVAVTSYALFNSETDSCFKKIAEKSGNSQLVQALDGMTGVGWDNLMNIVTEPVISSNFSKCQITPDGRFLIPDSVFAIPIQQSQIDQSAQFYDQFNDYWHKTTDEMNINAKAGYGVFSIGGSYSKKNIDTKYTMFSQQTSILHATLKHRAYILVSDLSAGLHPLFKNRLLEIAGYLRRGLSKQAKYLAEMIIRDYGTHYIERAEIGAIIEQEDFIQVKANETATSEFEEIKKAASASLKLKITGSVDGDSTQTSETNTTARYKSMIRQSNFRTIGGPSVDRLAKLNWNKTMENMMIDNLVPLNHQGAFLHSLVVKTNFPELARSELISLGHLLGNVTRDYFERNVIRGCTNPNSTNFNYQANYDDHSCVNIKENRVKIPGIFEGEAPTQPPASQPPQTQPPTTTTTTTTTTKPPPRFDITPYGGVYQKCTPLGKATEESCEKYLTKNILSNIYNCSHNFGTNKIVSTIQTVKSIEKRSGQVCNDESYFSPECIDYSFDVLHDHDLLIETYSCEKDGLFEPTGTVYFGGIYDEIEMNPLVGATGCPGRYEAYKIGTKTVVCLSYELEDEKKFRTEFGGFFSCQTPPTKAHCPNGFTQYLATVLNDCEIFYCAKTDNSLKNFNAPTIKRPPFMEDSVMLTNNTAGIIVGYIDGIYWMEMPVDKAIKSLGNVSNQNHNESINQWLDKTGSLIDRFYKEANASIEILLDQLKNVKSFP